MMSAETEDPQKLEKCSVWTLEDELEKNEKLRREDVDALREFCLTLPKVELNMITVELMVAFLHSCDFDLERARTVASKHFSIRIAAPEIFTNRTLDGDVGNGLNFGYNLAFPRKTPEGYQIIYNGVRLPDSSIFHYCSSLKTHFLNVDSCIHNNPTTAGYIFLFDLSKFSLGHIFKWSPFLTMTLTRYTQEGIPLKIQQMHVVNTSSFTHKILHLFKPFMSTHLWNMFKFHSSDNWETFYEYVPKECLPKDYGGLLPDLETLRKDHIEFLRKMQPKVDNLC